MSVEPLVSAVLVVVHRARAVGACLDSLARQDEPRWEALVVLNGATPEAEAEVFRRARSDARVRPVQIAATTASRARNIGLKEARAHLLYFLDDDVELPPGGIAAVARIFASDPGIAIAGGPNLTPPDDPPFAHITGELLASRLGTGIARPRYRSLAAHDAKERDLTLCNLAVRRALFRGNFAFPVLFGGEENVLMGHASHAGHRLWYSPELWVHHRRRVTVPSFLAQMHRYGFGRGLAIHSAPGTFHAAYFLPVLLVGYLAMLPFLSYLGPASFAPLGVYCGLVLLTTAAIAIRAERHAHALLLLPPLFFSAHVAYAFGLLRGLVHGARYGVRGRRADAPRVG